MITDPDSIAELSSRNVPTDGAFQAESHLRNPGRFQPLETQYPALASLASSDHGDIGSPISPPTNLSGPGPDDPPQISVSSASNASNTRPLFRWNDDDPPAKNYDALGATLAASGDVFRSARAGLILIADQEANVPVAICNPARLMALIEDRLDFRVIRYGRRVPEDVLLPRLKMMLESDAFLRHFAIVDQVVDRCVYLPPDFRPSCPGYNDAGDGYRVFQSGGPSTVSNSLDATGRFLDIMDFATPADRANTIAAALTILLRNHWPGGKPIVIVSGSRSHCGKGTIVDFVANTTSKVAIGYHKSDATFRSEFVAAIKRHPRIGLINIDNVRIGAHRVIGSPFLESYLTEPDPYLFGAGEPIHNRNDLVIAMTTNGSSVNEDLMNRALPIRLDPVGDVTQRTTPIGNPKLEYLPRHRDQIEAELRGMIERWRAAGRPLDESARHSFTPWARTIGGILRVHGIEGFLGNLSARKTADDPVRSALRELAIKYPDTWMSAREWARAARELGLIDRLVSEADRRSESGQERGIGGVLTSHLGDRIVVEHPDLRAVFRIEKARRRFEPGAEPSYRYQFAVEEEARIALDDEPATPMESRSG